MMKINLGTQKKEAEEDLIEHLQWHQKTSTAKHVGEHSDPQKDETPIPRIEKTRTKGGTGTGSNRTGHRAPSTTSYIGGSGYGKTQNSSVGNTVASITTASRTTRAGTAS